MASIFDVADYFRWRTDYNAGDNITQLKLQKLCYYAQAWHYTFTDQRLFPEEFEHWDHGPANYALYDRYRDMSWHPIDPGDIQETFSPAEVFTLRELETLQEVWDNYGDYGAKHLEKLTHQEDPWLNTPQNSIITVESMKEFYSNLLVDEDESDSETA